MQCYEVTNKPYAPRTVTRCVGYVYNLNKLRLRAPHPERPPNTEKKNYPRDNTTFTSKSRRISSDWENGNITHKNIWVSRKGGVSHSAAVLCLLLSNTFVQLYTHRTYTTFLISKKKKEAYKINLLYVCLCPIIIFLTRHMRLTCCLWASLIFWFSMRSVLYQREVND
jgi:hypothetical protein